MMKKLPVDFHTVTEYLEFTAEFSDDGETLMIARKTETLLRKFAREAGYDLDEVKSAWHE